MTNKQTCELGKCKRLATQADTTMNMWLCDDHYSLIGRLTDDYQADIEVIDKVERKMDLICQI